jgi:hypothetical protein
MTMADVSNDELERMLRAVRLETSPGLDARIGDLARRLGSGPPPGQFRASPIVRLARLAAAALVLLAAGVAVGRVGVAHNLEGLAAQVEASVAAKLEPAVRAQLRDEIVSEMQSALAEVRQDLAGQVAAGMDEGLRQVTAAAVAASADAADLAVAQYIRVLEDQLDRQNAAILADLDAAEQRRLQGDIRLRSDLRILAEVAEREIMSTRASVAPLFRTAALTDSGADSAPRRD